MDISSSSNSWRIRWKGNVHLYEGWQDVEDALSRGDLSLMHEIEFNHRWWNLGDFLEVRPWEESHGRKGGPVTPSESTGYSRNLEGADEFRPIRSERFWDLSSLKHRVLTTNFLLVVLALNALVLLGFFPYMIVSTLFFAVIVMISSFSLILKEAGYWPWVGIGLLGILAIEIIVKIVSVFSS